VLVSVIIPAFGQPQKLRRAVRSALAQDMSPVEYEVIVVDSYSTDENQKVVAELQSEAQCPLRFFRKQPEGPGPSRNLGAKQARGEFLAFMDSDCEASPQWLREAVDAFADGVGLVSGKIVPGPSPDQSVLNFTLEVREEHFLYHAANIVYRRIAFEEVGGFLADISPLSEKPMGGEDVDLAWRVKRAGWASCFAGNAVVVHEVVRISPWRWICVKHLYICPMLVRKHPELRRFFYRRYFFDKFQAFLLLAVLGLILGIRLPLALLLVLPYAYLRVSEPSGTLRGPMRLLRFLFYLPKDLVSMSLLLAGCIRFRALLL